MVWFDSEGCTGQSVIYKYDWEVDYSMVTNTNVFTTFEQKLKYLCLRIIFHCWKYMLIVLNRRGDFACIFSFYILKNKVNKVTWISSSNLSFFISFQCSTHTIFGKMCVETLLNRYVASIIRRSKSVCKYSFFGHNLQALVETMKPFENTDGRLGS